MQVLRPLPNEAYRDYALRVLKHNIISLNMEPGKMYSEKELASELGLSRTPMREALLQLAKIQIVEIYPQRGTAVALIDYAMVEEAQFLRDALECAIVRLVCQTATEELLAPLQGNLYRQQRCLQRQDLEPLMQLDNHFHKLLFSIADKMQSYAFVQSMTIHFDRVRSMAISAVKELVFVDEHQAIFSAIQRRDEALAASLMHAHLQRYRVDEGALRAKYPYYFKQ